MFVECTYTRPIRSETNPAHIEKALSLLGKFMNGYSVAIVFFFSLNNNIYSFS